MRKMQTVVVFVVLVSAAVAQDSLNCREKGSWPFGPSYAVAHDASRNLAFCGSGGGVYVLDVSNPAQPQRLSDAIRTRGLVDGLCYQANRLYIAADVAGLEIWDVTNPAAPARLGYYDTPSQARAVAVAGNHAYVADDEAGLRVISVSDPAHPSEVGYYDTPGYANGVAVAGNYAYVADYSAGLRVISVSDPAHPSEVGHYDTPGYANGVAVAGNYAYVAYYEVPPPVLGTQHLRVAGNYAHVADASTGLRVISVADPAHPSEVGYCGTPGLAEGVAVAGNYAYVADYSDGLRVISVSDPAHPSEVGHYDTPGFAHGVTVAGNHAYVADDEAGLRVIEFYGAGVEEMMNEERGTMNVGPTVVRGVLVLGAVDSRQNTAYRAELLDAAGRKVLDLEAGANDVRALAPGVYFAREPQTQAVTKVVLTR